MQVTKDDVIGDLRGHIAKYHKNIKLAAEAWSISGSFLYAVVAGEKPAPEWLLKKLGYTRAIVKTEVYTKEARKK